MLNEDIFVAICFLLAYLKQAESLKKTVHKGRCKDSH